MKRFGIIFLVLLMSVPLLAGDGYFKGGAGGWSYYYLPVDLGNLNTVLVNNMGVDGFDDYMYLNGFGGWGYVGRNYRIGGVGAVGEMVTTGKPGDVTKEARLTLNYGGVIIEKAVHPFDKSELYFGAMIGGGETRLNLSQWGRATDFTDVVGDGFGVVNQTDSSSYHNFENEFRNDFFMVVPTVGFRYNVFRWFAVGANVSYLYTPIQNDQWKLSGNRVYNMPELDYSNFVYSINIYFGG